MKTKSNMTDNREIKILNLYAGIGGNRKLWTNCKVTAIELDENIAKIYKDFFPNDEVIVADAHQYLLDHYKEYDFIWSSPPCQSHSSFRQNICVRFRGTKPEYPDMKLYQEILFLQNNFKGKWVVENVKPYYEPLIKPTKILQRHLFWSNFDIQDKEFEKDNIRTAQIPDLQKKYGFDLSIYKLSNKRQVLRNCVEPELGLHILLQITNLKEK
jgi:DNA (cytosine-5)-methyltransferase 1